MCVTNVMEFNIESELSEQTDFTGKISNRQSEQVKGTVAGMAGTNPPN